MKNSHVEIFIPGRLCILGEHSDWAASYQTINPLICDGMTLVLGLNKGVYLRAKKNRKFSYRCNVATLRTSIEIEMNYDEIDKAIEKKDLNLYVLATIRVLKESFDIAGMEIECYKMDLPVKKGLASSAAICMAIVRAANNLYNLNLSLDEEMNIAYTAEQNIGSKCGKMDQVCAYGNKLLLVRFVGDQVKVEPIELNSELNILVVDLNGEKNTRKILEDLNSRYPYPKTKMDENLHNALGYINQKCVKSAVTAMEDGLTYKIGEIMTSAQIIFDKFVSVVSPIELESKRLHEILNDEHVKKFIHGGKGVGSQGDGCVQLLLKDSRTVEELEEYILAKYGYDCFLASETGVKDVVKAVIPIAGYATRLYPTSKVIEKALLPVYDSDGLLKPALIIQIEELINSGIEKVCLVIREDQTNIKNLFDIKYEYEERMDYYQVLKKLGDRVEFVYQNESRGFGAAILESKKFADNDNVLVALGDYLLKSNESCLCTMQLLNYWKKYKGIMVTIKEIGIQDVPNYGVLTGKWIDKEKKVMKVTSFIEKPTVEYAKEHLGMKAYNDKTAYFCVFGQYVINNSVYNLLDRNVKSHNEITEEVDLTQTLNEFAQKGLLYGVSINGKSFDIGLPDQYYYTMCNYSSDKR